MQSRNELHDAINRLTEDQRREVMGVVRGFLGKGRNGVFERLSMVPGIRIPSR